jgi:large subunit ribosomal protein L10
MSRQVKEMLVEEYRQRLEGVDDAILIDIRELDANTNNTFRRELGQKDIRVTVVRNNLAHMAFKGTGLAGFDPLLTGPSAIAYGGESVVNVAREIMEWSRRLKKLNLKGAVLDGQLFEGKAGVEVLSNFPTREEAVAQVVQLVLTPGGQVVSCATSPGSNILSIVKEIEERLEKGEAITKAG